METKTCTRCSKEKPLEAFGNCNATDSRGAFKDGKTYHCRECHNEIRREWTKTHRESETAANKKWNQEHPEFRIWASAKYRANKVGCPFSIDWRTDVKIPEVCPVLGIPLKFGEKHSQDDSPSLDRVIPELGYVPGNVAVISHKANTMKSNATLSELKRLVAWMEK